MDEPTSAIANMRIKTYRWGPEREEIIMLSRRINWKPSQGPYPGWEWRLFA